MSGNKKDHKRTKRKKPLSHGWIAVPSKSYRDRVYFYNVVTKCSTWINPCEVFDDETSSKSSSDTSVISRQRRLPTVYLSKKRALSENFLPVRRDNPEIEDYDEEQDKFFDDIPFREVNQSRSNKSLSSSPDSAFSSKTFRSDSDTSKTNIIFENDRKELWLHFASSPKKRKMKKALALSDFEQPSTSGLDSRADREKVSLTGGSQKDPKDDENSRRKSSRGRKKKRSSKEENAKPKKQDKQSFEKTEKNISFKPKDRTPAQTGILKFRREYAEKIKKLAESSSTPFKSKLDLNKSFNLSGSVSTVESLDYPNYTDRSCRDMGKKNIFQQDEDLNDDSSEEMDWEPSSEESDVRNINEFRQQYDRGQTNNSIFYELNWCPKIILPSQELVLVLDTNIFVSCLNFVKELRDTKIGDLGYPIIYVPWRVLQELDHLKDSKIDGARKHLSSNVRKAISFLNENFKFKHPRVFGQSFEDFNKMMDLNNFAPDDEILQTCIELQKKHSNIKLMLLTNDKNLESKANVSGVSVFSKESFEKKFKNNNLSHSTCDNSAAITSALQVQVQPGVSIDKYICEIKVLLKEYLSIIVETEMRLAFEEDWIKIIHHKPPWTAREALECFLKHWHSVFFVVFSKTSLNEAENLNKKLFLKQAGSMEDVFEIISSFQRFIKSINTFQKKKRPYMNLTDSFMSKLSRLQLNTPLNDSAQVDSSISQIQYPSITNSSEPFQAQLVTEQITTNDMSKVKDLFRDIWETLRCFCCTMSDVINSPNPCSNASLPELRLKLSQILYEVGELIVSIEKIFEINVSDISERHPLIIQFGHFLSNLYPAITLDLQNKFLKCLSAFFTDFEGRSLLSRSLVDFRDFSQELVKTSEFLKAHLT